MGRAPNKSATGAVVGEHARGSIGAPESVVTRGARRSGRPRKARRDRSASDHSGPVGAELLWDERSPPSSAFTGLRQGERGSYSTITPAIAPCDLALSANDATGSPRACDLLGQWPVLGRVASIPAGPCHRQTGLKVESWPVNTGAPRALEHRGVSIDVIRRPSASGRDGGPPGRRCPRVGRLDGDQARVLLAANGAPTRAAV